MRSWEKLPKKKRPLERSGWHLQWISISMLARQGEDIRNVAEIKVKVKFSPVDQSKYEYNYVFTIKQWDGASSKVSPYETVLLLPEASTVFVKRQYSSDAAYCCWIMVVRWRKKQVDVSTTKPETFTCLNIFINT